MLKSVIALCLLSQVCAADNDVVVSGRVGDAYFHYRDDAASEPLTGNGFTAGMQLGIEMRRFHIEPAIGMDVAMFNPRVHDSVIGDFDIRVRTLSASLRLRVILTSSLDVIASTGSTGIEFTSPHLRYPITHHGWHYEIAAGVRLWHDANQSLRLEVAARTMSYLNDSQQTLNQIGGDVAYALRF